MVTNENKVNRYNYITFFFSSQIVIKCHGCDRQLPDDARLRQSELYGKTVYARYMW